MLYPSRNTPDFQTGLTGQIFPENDTGNIQILPLSRYTDKRKKGAFFHAENEQEAAAGMGVLPQ